MVATLPAATRNMYVDGECCSSCQLSAPGYGADSRRGQGADTLVIQLFIHMHRHLCLATTSPVRGRASRVSLCTSTDHRTCLSQSLRKKSASAMKLREA